MAFIAVTGFRGVPATWGGIERQCEEIYSRIAKKGHRVVIYARSHYVPKDIRTYKGMEIRRVPTINTKYAEAFLHTFLCVLHIIATRPDIVHIYAQGPSIFSPLIRIFMPRARLFFTCCGLDWQRSKWPKWASAVIRLGEICSARFPHVRTAVSEDLARYYERHYGVPIHYIPNGIPEATRRPARLIREFGLSARGYFLFVGRLAPEKRVEDIISAYLFKDRQSKLVIVGESAGTGAYVKRLRQMASGADSVLFVGYRHGEILEEFYSNARAFITASELEGLPLTVLEALSFGLPCITSDIAPHREILNKGNTRGCLFPLGNLESLSEWMDIMESTSDVELDLLGSKLAKAIEEHFSWDAAARMLEALYLESCQKPEY